MLPVIDTPIFELTLPSSGKKYNYRPFLVKEQKSLLIAQESGEASSVRETLFSIIDSCLFNKVQAKHLPYFDIDFIFIKLRSKSIGETVELEVQCTECDTKNPYNLNLDSICAVRTDGHSNKIFLTENIGVTMRYPTVEEVDYLKTNYSVSSIYETIAKCVEMIFDHDTITLSKDISAQEIIDWLDKLQQKHYDKFEEFFKTQPVIKTDIVFTCGKCKAENKFVVEGIDDFFA